MDITEPVPVKNFADRVIDTILERKSYLCVGLDPQLRYFPPHLLKWAYKEFGPGWRACGEAIFAFNQTIMNATAEYGLCFKPQIAFYEQYKSEGIRAFERTIDYGLSMDMIMIEDGKREDGDDTSSAYASGHLGEVDVIGKNGELVKAKAFDVSAITVTPWIFEPNFKPFVEAAVKFGKGVFVVDRTSFKPTSDLQEMKDADGVKGWVKLTRKINELGQECVGKYGYSPIGAVMGATYPEDAPTMQQELPRAFKLIPGFGAGQKGKAEGAVVCVNDDGFGIIVNNSRGTNYAYHPVFKTAFQCDSRNFAGAAAKASLQARDELNNAVFQKIGRLPW